MLLRQDFFLLPILRRTQTIHLTERRFPVPSLSVESKGKIKNPVEVAYMLLRQDFFLLPILRRTQTIHLTERLGKRKAIGISAGTGNILNGKTAGL